MRDPFYAKLSGGNFEFSTICFVLEIFLMQAKYSATWCVKQDLGLQCQTPLGLKAGVNKKQENSLFFPRQKFCNPCISRSKFAPTPLINQFFLVFKQQLFEVTKKNIKKTKKMYQK